MNRQEWNMRELNDLHATGTTPAVASARAQRADVHVPMSDLRGSYDSLGAEINEALLKAAASTNYILGPSVEAFEGDFARFVGAKHCVAVNSGTSALHLAMIGAGVGAGDEVITVPMTFIATAWGISYVGAKPVFVDVDPVTCTMDVGQVERRITSRTRAILPVHLYGQMADMGPLLEIGRRYGIPVIEDAAQAHGAAYDGNPAGSMGVSGCFSFYPGKNLGAFGEAGAVVVNDDAVAARMRSLRDHGQRQRYHHDEVGFNYRMDGIQGAVLGVKLKHLPAWTEARRRLAARYDELLGDLTLELPTESAGRRHVWHLYVALHPDRDRIRQELQARNIQSGLHYPVPLHLQKAYAHLGHNRGDFPVAERVADQCLTLPLFSEMTTGQQDAVVEVLRSVVSQ
jgi:dTDP-4-amino-4,6-dideoxygalactose transaminase